MAEDTGELRNIISELCRQFYSKGWMTGTGGAISVKTSSHILVTPSGVQKERVQPDDLVVLTMDGDLEENLQSRNHLKKSSCTPLFMNAYTLRDAGAVIHTHSKHAVLASLLCSGREFRAKYLQTIRLIRDDETGVNFRFDDELVIPIIENTLHEDGLKTSMARAMSDYPKSPAVLVRRHGLFVWGPTWQKAKVMCEGLDYLFEMAVEMKKLGLDPNSSPVYADDAYITDEHIYVMR